MTQSTAEALSGMNLTELEFHYSHDFPLSSLNGFSKLTTLFFRGDNTSSLVIGSVDLPALTDLTLISWQIEDFSGLSAFPVLRPFISTGQTVSPMRGSTGFLPLRASTARKSRKKTPSWRPIRTTIFIFLV